MNKQEYLVEIDKVIKAGKFKDNWESLSQFVIPDWYQKGRFGLFVHWGVYSVPAFFNEWYMYNLYSKCAKVFEYHEKKYGAIDKFGYKDLIPLFKAENFCADEWLQLFKESGAKYIMPVAEHHDGFKMYQSDLSRWNSVEMGPKRDIMSELKKSCEKYDIGFLTSSHRAEHYWFASGGRKFSCDVQDDNYRDLYGPAVLDKNGKCNDYEAKDFLPTEEWCEDWLVHTCELIDKTQPLALYFDWWVRKPTFRPYMKKFAAYYYNRGAKWGKQVAIFYKMHGLMQGSGVYDVERGQLDSINSELWQNDTAMAKNSWGYTENNKFKTPNDLICNMVDVISKNGCFMLNCGPKADGTICDEEKHLLKEIGKWLKINGEGIYDSKPYTIYGEGKKKASGTFKENLKYTAQDIRFTYKTGAIYVYILQQNKKGKYVVSSLGNSNSKCGYVLKNVELFGFENKITFSQTSNELLINVVGSLDTDLPICFKVSVD